MNQQIENIKLTRKWLLEIADGLSIEQLNVIPQGFNNNIIWNMGHVVAAQQGLCYSRAGLTTVVDEHFMVKYKTGSKPGAFIDEAGLALVKELMFSTLDELDIDMRKKIFYDYQPWKTRYGVAMNNVEDAVNFVGFHEGLHTGVVMALKKIV